ncbi:MAG: RnfABCDGE type electron transport complex subunit G [Myxococcales bacterium]|nr:RnfABCDGE type electron transport complex subunit G [Myxococcales bacterium]
MSATESPATPTSQGAATAAANEPGSLRLALTLGFAGLLSGLILVLVYQFTLPIIEANRALALKRAVLQVVPGAVSMQKLGGDGATLAPIGEDEKATVFAAFDDQGAFKGFAITGEGAGFQDTIQLIYGFDPAKKQVVGLRVLESRETPGLGDKIIKDQGFVGQFDDLAVEPTPVVVKAGEGGGAHQVDAITGATISSKAVVKIMNTAHGAWAGKLPPAAALKAPGGAP